MPTGYTSQLESSNWNLEKWLREQLCRGLGFGIMLRDDGVLSEREIKKRLVSSQADSLKFWKAQLKSSKSKLKAANRRSLKQWQLKHNSELALLEKELAEIVKERKEKTVLYNQTLEKIKAYQKQAKTPAGKGLIAFALDQLNAVRCEFGEPEYLVESIKRYKMMSLNEFIRAEKTSLRHSIESAEKYIKESISHEKTTVKTYLDILKDCDRFFGRKKC